MRDYLNEIKEMEVGRTLVYPKELRNKINSVITRLFCHGKMFLVRTDREKDYVTVTRVE